MPASATISPAAASSMSVRFSPSNDSRRVTLWVSTAPFSLRMAIGLPIRIVPREIRPIAIRPT